MKFAEIDDGIFVNLELILYLYIVEDDDKFKVVVKTIDMKKGVLVEGFHTEQAAKDWVRRFEKGTVEPKNLRELNPKPSDIHITNIINSPRIH